MTSRITALLALTVLAAACESDVFVGSDLGAGSAASGGGDGARDAAGASGGAGAGGRGTVDGASCTPTVCEGRSTACGDCVDNDGDGRVDLDDPDCLGPCHDAEDNFQNPMPNGPACELDCYFDGNNGSGDDQCTWSHRCDPLSVAPDFPPEGDRCAYDPTTTLPRQGTCATSLDAQPSRCAERCLPLVPNGCDCFGCCAVPGAPTPIWLGSVDESGAASCDLAHVADPSRCRPCTQVPSCLNPCERCERCVGKAKLPADCNPGSDCDTPECTRGAPCGSPCLPPCGDGEACITGCCAAIPR